MNQGDVALVKASRSEKLEELAQSISDLFRKKWDSEETQL
jgi:hypothetical protein